MHIEVSVMSEPINAPSMQAVVQEIKETQATLDSAIAAARRRNTISLCVSLLLLALLGAYLVYFHDRFSNEVTPADAGNYIHGVVTDQLPAAQVQLEAAIKQNTPHFLDRAQERLMAMPDDVANETEKRLRAQMDQQMPVIEDQLYEALTMALAQAPPPQLATNDDVARYTAVLDSAAALYKSQTLKLADGLYDQYEQSSGSFISDLDALAQNHNLTPKQKHEREMFRDYLIIVRADQQQGGETLIPELMVGSTTAAPTADHPAPKPQ